MSSRGRREGCGWLRGSAPLQRHKCHITQGSVSPEGQEWRAAQIPWTLQQRDADPPSHIPALQTDHRPSSLGSHLVTTLSPVNCHGNHKQITNTELAPPSPRAAALQLSCAPCRDHCHQGAKNCPQQGKSSWPVQNEPSIVVLWEI